MYDAPLDWLLSEALLTNPADEGDDDGAISVSTQRSDQIDLLKVLEKKCSSATNGIPYHKQIQFNIFEKNTKRFICRCEQLYKESDTNSKTFIAKNKKCLFSTSNLQLHDTLYEISYRNCVTQNVQEEPEKTFLRIPSEWEVKETFDSDSTS